jgi:hypothetical protein
VNIGIASFASVETISRAFETNLNLATPAKDLAGDYGIYQLCMWE